MEFAGGHLVGVPVLYRGRKFIVFVIGKSGAEY